MKRSSCVVMGKSLIVDPSLTQNCLARLGSRQAPTGLTPACLFTLKAWLDSSSRIRLMPITSWYYWSNCVDLQPQDVNARQTDKPHFIQTPWHGVCGAKESYLAKKIKGISYLQLTQFICVHLLFLLKAAINYYTCENFKMQVFNHSNLIVAFCCHFEEFMFEVC